MCKRGDIIVKLEFDKMCMAKKIYWKIKLFWMDHRISFIEDHWRLLEPSYYYTHTEEESQKEKQRRVSELMRIIEGVE